MKNKSVILGIISLFIVLTIVPTVFAAQNTISNVTGNTTDYVLYFSLTTSQITSNPKIGEDITYTTIVNVTVGDIDSVNITSFNFDLPDNSTTVVASDFTFRNITGDERNASSFVQGAYNYVVFSGLDPMFNLTTNGTTFNITWKLSSPIVVTKLSTSLNGRAYTETWNVTSSATNMTITNASLIVVPSYWYVRQGSPTTVTFNSTTESDYIANFTRLNIYTDLDLGNGVGNGNMILYGSGAETLSVTYNGPTIQSSSGSSASTLSITSTVLGEVLQDKRKLALWIGVFVLVSGGIMGLVVFLKKQ